MKDRKAVKTMSRVEDRLIASLDRQCPKVIARPTCWGEAVGLFNDVISSLRSGQRLRRSRRIRRSRPFIPFRAGSELAEGSPPLAQGRLPIKQSRLVQSLRGEAAAILSFV